MSPRKRFDPRSALLGSPFLTRVALREDRVQPGVFPFTVPWLLPTLALELSAPVTFFVGENGTGKSTLLEAIAWSVGFGAQGGNRDQSFTENADGHALGRALRLSWRRKVSGGFFLRAETFFNFVTYLEEAGSDFRAYGGKSLHRQSHGEAFLLDEPEAALSPQRQLAFLRVLHDLSAQKIAQFLIATHSPILLTFPGATILSLDAGQMRRVTYEETDHFQITRDFLNAPERYYRHLLEDGD
jgi:predicted ATPase